LDGNRYKDGDLAKGKETRRFNGYSLVVEDTKVRTKVGDIISLLIIFPEVGEPLELFAEVIDNGLANNLNNDEIYLFDDDCVQYIVDTTNENFFEDL
jgi:hypothetical protein